MPILADILPQTEQSNARNAMYVSKNYQVQQYVGNILDPSGQFLPDVSQRKLPDSFPRKTALVRSVQTFEISIPYIVSASSDTGRFAIAIQPWMGATDKPYKYKIGITNPAGPYSLQDWSDQANYLDDIMGVDPRVDRFWVTLTQQTLGVYQLFNASGSTTPKVFPDSGFDPPETACGSWFHQNTDGISLQDTGSGNPNEWELGPGQYVFSYESTTADTFTAGPTLTVVSANTGDMTKDLNHSVRSPDNKMAALFHLLTVKATVRVRLTSALTTGGATYTNSVLRFTPATYSAADQSGTSPVAVNANSIPSADYGITSQYRTVSMSALLTFTGSSLANAGDVAAAYIPGNSLKTSFYTSSPNPSLGSLQMWENIANIPDAASFPLKKGCYVWWTPEDIEGDIMKPPDKVLDGDPPGIVIAGQYQPNDVPGSDTAYRVLRLIVATNYEICTNSQLFGSERYIGSTDVLDEANRILGQLPHVWENPEHASFIKDVWNGFKKGIGWVGKGIEVADKILPILGL